MLTLGNDPPAGCGLPAASPAFKLSSVQWEAGETASGLHAGTYFERTRLPADCVEEFLDAEGRRGHTTWFIRSSKAVPPGGFAAFAAAAKAGTLGAHSIRRSLRRSLRRSARRAHAAGWRLGGGSTPTRGCCRRLARSHHGGAAVR